MSDPKYPTCRTCGRPDYPGDPACLQCTGFGNWTPRPAAADQPAPRPGTAKVLPSLIKDLEARDAKGIEKYGCSLEAGNTRDALMDALQEALDLAMYLKQAIMERDAKQSNDM